MKISTSENCLPLAMIYIGKVGRNHLDATPVENYDQLIQALRARIAELGIVLDTIDQVAGLPARYAAKLLSPEPIKQHLGATSLFPVLQALGLRLRLEPDDQAIEKLSKRSDWCLMVRSGPRYRPRYDRRRRISSRRASEAAGRRA